MALALTLTRSAYAEEPTPGASPLTAEAAETRAFEARVTRVTRLRAFTEELISEREQRAFTEAADRYARAVEFTKRLAVEREQQSQQEFEKAMALYLRKLEFARELSRRAHPVPLNR